MASQASTADSAASRHCQKRNLVVPGAATPSVEVLVSAKSARLAGRFACFAWTLSAGAGDPAGGAVGVLRLDRGRRGGGSRGGVVGNEVDGHDEGPAASGGRALRPAYAAVA